MMDEMSPLKDAIKKKMKGFEVSISIEPKEEEMMEEPMEDPMMEGNAPEMKKEDEFPMEEATPMMMKDGYQPKSLEERARIAKMKKK